MKIQTVKYFIHLVEKGRTGTPSECARKLMVTERTIYFYVKRLKSDLEAPIVYNKFRNSYEFSRPGRLNWEWVKHGLH
jgi:DNA-binding transcriptional LysR family regulator